MSEFDLEGGGGGGESFASVMGSFGKLTEIQSRISKALDQAKVPWSETRKFLSGRTVTETASTPLAQFITDLFREIGLGELELVSVDNFSYTFRNPDCPLCGLFSDVRDKKVCNATTEALQRFFNSDLDLMNVSEETHCRNAGDGYCQFTVDVRRLSVYMILLDKVNMQIIRESFGSCVDEDILRRRLNLSGETVAKRLERLRELRIFDHENRLTESGEAFRQYLLGNPPVAEEEFDPPWKAMSQISEAIAATTSFAEALVEIMDDDSLPWEETGEELAALKEDAKGAAGFGELLSSAMKKDGDSREGGDDDKEEEEEEGRGSSADGKNDGGGGGA